MTVEPYYERRTRFAQAETVWKNGLVPRVLQSNVILRKKNMTGNNIFKKYPWACFGCNFSRSLHCAFDRLDATAERIPIIFLRFSGFSLNQMGPKVNFDDFLWNHHLEGAARPNQYWWFLVKPSLGRGRPTQSILIRWPINRSNRFSDFLRLDRLDRCGKIIRSNFSKFWKREFQFFSDF